MRFIIGSVLTLALTAGAALPAAAQSAAPSPAASAALAGVLDPAPPTTGTTAKGQVFVAPDGRTLYTYDPDTATSSKCNGACAVNWPPLLAPDTATATGKFTIVTRDDGRKQWAYGGKPLYLWAKDAKAGDITGDGVGGRWHLATP